jgi:hypothetical protein
MAFNLVEVNSRGLAVTRHVGKVLLLAAKVKVREKS